MVRPLDRRHELVLYVGLLVYALFLAREAFVLAVGPQDNDWPLLMWLAEAGVHGNLGALAVGHYGFLQLLAVKLLAPLLGGTLWAAKALNISAIVASAVALYRIVVRLTGAKAWALVGVATFLLTYETFITGWSEFGDPLALAFFAAGLAVFFESSSHRRVLLAGVLVGIAGLVRLHFQTLGWGTIVCVGGLEYSRLPLERRNTMARIALFAAGVLVGQLPVFALNMVVHGQLFSPIAKSFMGQVIYGANQYNMGLEYAAADYQGLFSSDGLKLVSIIADRLVGAPLYCVIIVCLSTVALARRNDTVATRAFFVLIALGYYVGFVSPSWGITPRLLMPLMFVTGVCLALVGAALLGEQSARRQTAAIAMALLFLTLHFRGERRAFRAVRNATRTTWDRNVTITKVLRDNGIRDARQVFAADWNVYPTDDPKFIGFYNFGFWNLLVPEFSEERPNPYPARYFTDDFERFLAGRGVRALIVHDEPLLPAVQSLWRSGGGRIYKVQRGFEHGRILLMR